MQFTNMKKANNNYKIENRGLERNCQINLNHKNVSLYHLCKMSKLVSIKSPNIYLKINNQNL